jgi:hypothetical protein
MSIRKVDLDEMEMLWWVNTLGVMLKLEETDKAEVTYLGGNAEEWAEHIRTGVSTKNVALGMHWIW